MTALNMAKHRNNPNFAFWKMIKEGYDDFEATHQEPKVAVCEKRYVFDATPPSNSSRPLRFDPRGKCPVYQLDPSVADAVLDHRRHEEYQMAQYIAERVATVPPRTGLDGGMNPVFAEKLATHNEFDSNGRIFQVAGNTQAPGALPRTPNPPATAAERPQPVATAQPLVMASVPMPQPAPQPKEGEAPPEHAATIAGLFGNLFSGSKAQAEPVSTESEGEAMALRGTTQVAVKPKPAATFRTASTQMAVHAKPHEASAPNAAPKAEPKTAAAAAPEPERKPSEKPPVKQAETPQAPANELRTAYSAPRERRPAQRRATGGAGRHVRQPVVRTALTARAGKKMSEEIRSGINRSDSATSSNPMTGFAWIASSTSSAAAPSAEARAPA